MTLADWWHSTWSDLGLPQPEPQLLEDLLGRYAEPHRAYHTAQHLEECCDHFSRARSLVTKHNGAPDSPDAGLMVDIDLSILGASVPRFDEYEEQVRREFAWVSEEAFRTARSRILGEFLARPRIYSTEFFHGLLEAQARSNLQRSLGRLGA